MKNVWIKLCLLVIVVGGAGLWGYWAIRNPGNGPSEDDSYKRQIKEAELDPKKQKQIWNVEHIAFVLEQRFGRAFLKVLTEKKTNDLLPFALASFQAKVLQQKGSVRDNGMLREVRKIATSESLRTATKSQWAKYITSYRNSLAKITGTTLRVLQLHQHKDDAERWTAHVYLSLHGTDEKGRPVEVSSEHSVQCRIADSMAVDKVPILESWQVQSEVLRRSRRFLMQEVTKAYDLHWAPIPDNWKTTNPIRHTSDTAVADFNQDGFLDIAVGLWQGNPIILQSEAGKIFRDVTIEIGVVKVNQRWNYSTPVAWIDFNNDDFPDLLVAGRLYRNVKGKRFEDVTAGSGLRVHPSCMSVTVADYDADGFLDLYLIYEAPFKEKARKKPRPWVNDSDTGEENQLWRNLGDGRFENVTKKSGAGGGKARTFAVAWFFYDDDRFPDLYMANDFGKNVLLRNRGNGTFEDVSYESGATGFATSMGVATGDIDNDGTSDIYVANMFSKMGRRIIGQVCDADYPKGIFEQLQGSCAGNRLYLRKRSSMYRDYSHEMGVNAVGWAFAPAMFDLDADGWLDLYATTGFMSFSRKEPDG